MAEKEEEEDKEIPEHFNRMTYLVFTIGTDIVRQLFVKDIPTGQSVGTFLKNNEIKIKLLEKKHVLNVNQLQLLKSSQPDVNKFDITLLYILICNLSNMDPPSGGWQQAMRLLHDTSPAALLMKLKTARNEIIAHSPNGKMTKSSFENHWSATSDILIDLASAISQDEKRAVKEKVDEMRKKPIGDEVYKQNTLEMWDLQDHVGEISSGLDELSKKTATQETRTGSIDTTVHALQGQMATLLHEMATLITKMATQETRTGSIDTTVHALHGQMATILNEMATLNTKIATQEGQTDTSVQNLTDQIATLDTKIATQETRTGSIDTTVHALQGQMATLNTKIATQGGQTDTSVQNLTDQIATLDTKIVTQETRTGSIDTTVYALQGQMATILNEMATLNTKIATQGGQTDTSVQTLTDQIATLDTKMATQETRTGSIDTTVHALQSQMSALNTKIATQGGHTVTSVQTLTDQIATLDTKSEQALHRRLDPGDQKYDKLKQKLQKEIIDHYRRNNCFKTAIPSLIKGRKTDVNEVFVMPLMRVVEPGTSTSSPNKATKKQPKDITRIHEMFISEGEAIGKVYLRGEAGTGKTTLCQKIVYQWCNVHTSQQTEIKADEEKFLKNIELLFYIQLRNHNNKSCDIIEMIKSEVVRKRHYNDLDLILENESENCLIILDGLDEWTPSPDCRHEVPYIDPKEKFTVLTTSRPWKLEVLRPEMCDLGQIELCKLDQDHLIKVVVKLLNRRSGNTVDWKCFKYTDEARILRLNVVKGTYKKIQHLADIPVILTAMVCMWHDGEEIGTTRIQAYGKMVEYLMNVAVKRNPMIEEPSTMMEPQQSTATELVDVFKGYPCCEMHNKTLFKLSDLAYHTLFNPKKENSLVFHHKDTEMYNLTEGDVKFCLDIGLLSQSEFYGKAASDMKCISFLHKTLQEFFAAIFIAHGGKELLPPMKTLDDVFEMAEVLRFVSGLRPDLIVEISHHIAELTDRDDRILKYRNSFRKDCGNRDIVERVQTIIRDCIVEVPTDKLGCKVELYDVIYEDLGKFLMFPKIESCIDTYTTILPYLNTEHIKSLWTIKNAYNLLDSVGHNLVKLGVELESAEDMHCMVSAIDRCSSCLSVVSVSSDSLTNSSITWDNLITSLCRISHLTCLRLSSMMFTHSSIEDLVRFLSTNTQLSEIDVGSIICTTCGHGQCEYTVDLSQHIYLQYLSIVDLDGDFVLSSDTLLEYCVTFFVKCGLSIVNRLRSSTTLQMLEVGALHPPQACGSTVLTQVIPTLMNLRKLVLWCIDFKQDILRLSPGMTSLKDVDLLNTTMTLQCVQGFIDSLPRTECRVEMNNVNICPRGDMSTAVKYITDRYPGTEPWMGNNIIENDQINVFFTNRPSHSEDDNDDDDDDYPEGLNDDLDDDDDDDDLEEEEEEDDTEESNLGLLQQTGDLEDEEDDEDYKGYEDEQAEVVQEEGRPTARPCVIHESSQQELGTGVQKVDQRLGHVSAAVQKNESSLQELGTDVRKVDQGHDHLSAALQKNESSLQKVEQQQDHLSAAVQKNESSLQTPPAITILYDRQEENRKKRKGEELDETVPSQPSNKWFKSSNTAESGIHTEVEQRQDHVSAAVQKNESSLQELGTDIQKTKQPETSDLETDK